MILRKLGKAMGNTSGSERKTEEKQSEEERTSTLHHAVSQGNVEVKDGCDSFVLFS